MATLTDLRKRMRGVKTICQLAGAMRTVSSAKLSRLSAAVYAFTPYAQGCRDLQSAAGAFLSPAPNAPEETLTVLLSGNRGLCGSYHSELFAFFRSLPEQERMIFIPCGKMAAAYLAERHMPVLESIPVSDVPEFAQAEMLADRILELYTGGTVNRVLMVYSEAVNALRQEPRCLELLPGERVTQEHELLWLPDLDTARTGLAETCLRAQVYSLMLTAASGVQAATLTSMRSAYDNGMKSAAALETEINRKRQTQVTASVIETSSGLRPEGEG